MTDRRKRRQHRSTDAQSRRIRRLQLRMRRLEGLKLAKEAVVLSVGNERRVENVVMVVVTGNLGAQMLRAFYVIHRGAESGEEPARQFAPGRQVTRGE